MRPRSAGPFDLLLWSTAWWNQSRHGEHKRHEAYSTFTQTANPGHNAEAASTAQRAERRVTQSVHRDRKRIRPAVRRNRCAALLQGTKEAFKVPQHSFSFFVKRRQAGSRKKSAPLPFESNGSRSLTGNRSMVSAASRRRRSPIRISHAQTCSANATQGRKGNSAFNFLLFGDSEWHIGGQNATGNDG
jgi:hypothetical protein